MFKLRDCQWFGGKKNHTAFEADGFIRFDGDATFFANVPATLYKVAGTGGATLSESTVGTAGVAIAYSFSASAENTLFATIQLPAAYKSGSLVKIYADWIPASNDVDGKVDWLLSYQKVIPGLTTGIVATDPTAVGAAPAAVDDTTLIHVRNTVFALPDTDLVPGTLLHLALLRDGDDATNDTHTAASLLLNLRAVCECDTLGLRTATTK